MQDPLRDVEEAVQYLKTRIKSKPTSGIVLGTGLGRLAQEITSDATIPYDEIPHFVKSTVETHAGKLIFGELNGKRLMAMHGRFHFYEGYSMREITFPIRVMKALGCATVILSNASGGLNPTFHKGDIMVIVDHINLLGDNPLRGPNVEKFGPRFPDMCDPYDQQLIDLVETAALEESIQVKKGVYVAVPGPNLETRAEYRFLRIIGADAVGMSTVPEVIVARHMGMRVLGLSIITDMGLPDALIPVDVTEILRVADRAEPALTRLIRRVVERL
ncbi:purine nucleoside phosphorylase [candidate division TA06 bacterium DG_26]|uniref:Purine nucleoside phosphorylase n=1 Tax=candidate division TA06 bacterium DG_26 TaxID=1703771 RepID=A0A0S7WKT3_UNCT6|nr:MAG: purine nucleoside phosphorylase [candidate division TA06 bacterium DG_26]